MTDQRLQEILTELSEHFDCVQVMLSFCEEGGTTLKQFGRGNWYARQGMAHEFINSDIAIDNANQIAKKLNGYD